MTTDTTTTTATRTIHATDSGLLVLIDEDTSMSAAITIDGLRLAHDAEIRIGCHPYASATAWTSIALLPTLATAFIDPADALMIEDWLDWCDDVFARYEDNSSEESIASSAQQTGAITEARYLDEVNATIAAEQAA
jgi:hypothetical protein